MDDKHPACAVCNPAWMGPGMMMSGAARMGYYRPHTMTPDC